MINFQVQLSAGANPLIAAGLPPVYASWLSISSAGALRFGGPTVSATAGRPIAANTPLDISFDTLRGGCLNNMYVAGAGTVDVCYEPST